MEQQDWEGCVLDKDFLSGGSKIYSPTTCAFLPEEVNGFIANCSEKKGEHPLGVRKVNYNKTNPYLARSGKLKPSYIGYFNNPHSAHIAWLEVKLSKCEEYITKYSDKPRVLVCLLKLKSTLTYHISNDIEMERI